jgi:hypothetical protein
MTSPYRALCAELLVALKSWSPHGGGPLECWEDREEEAVLIARAEALLAQSEPAAPTDDALLQLAREWNSGYESIDFDCIADYAREVLARYSRSTFHSTEA